MMYIGKTRRLKTLKLKWKNQSVENTKREQSFRGNAEELETMKMINILPRRCFGDKLSRY